MFQNTIRNNAIVVAGAVGTALAAWGVCQLGGIDLTVGKGSNPSSIDAVDAIVAALIAGAAACCVHGFMVRRRWSRRWPFVAGMALAVSMTGPSYLADGGAAVALICMHLLVGGVLIGGLAVFGRAQHPDEPSHNTLSELHHRGVRGPARSERQG